MFRSKALLVVVGLTSFGVAAFKSAAARDVVNEHKHVMVGAKASAYPEAVLVDMNRDGNEFTCSGAMIAPTVVLTAGHCVAGYQSFRVTAPFTAKGEQVAQSTHSASFDYARLGYGVVDKNRHDIGLIFLETPIETEYPNIAQMPISDHSKIINVGRSSRGASVDLLFGAPVAASPAANAGYPYDYVSDPVIELGGSGGPVFQAGTHTIVGVNSAFGEGFQVMARTDLVYSWIEREITSHSQAALAHRER